MHRKFVAEGSVSRFPLKKLKKRLPDHLGGFLIVLNLCQKQLAQKA
jgi:hypothetical protein